MTKSFVLGLPAFLVYLKANIDLKIATQVRISFELKYTTCLISSKERGFLSVFCESHFQFRHNSSSSLSLFSVLLKGFSV